MRHFSKKRTKRDDHASVRGNGDTDDVLAECSLLELRLDSREQDHIDIVRSRMR